MARYSYDGPVKEFDFLVTEHWHGETTAMSERKARSNLTYQYKKSHNKISGSKITLTGKIVEID